jgi:hypothetical protein
MIITVWKFNSFVHSTYNRNERKKKQGISIRKLILKRSIKNKNKATLSWNSKKSPYYTCSGVTAIIAFMVTMLISSHLQISFNVATSSDGEHKLLIYISLVNLSWENKLFKLLLFVLKTS